MLPMYVRNAVAAVFVYDITRYDSFRNLDYWFLELSRHIPNKVFKYVLANKCDLQSSRVISETEGREYALSKEAYYFETSALNGRGIEKAMQTIAENLVEYHLLSSDDSQFTLTSNLEYEDEENKKEKGTKRFCCNIS
jgi:GTPase SAR1 family protein